MKNKIWEEVGVIGVDAGLCWLGDPCYILPDDASERTDVIKDWSKFCDAIKDKDTHQFQYNMGHDGLGVVVSTGWGDGEYPVLIRRNKAGRIAEVRVVFDTDSARDIAKHLGLTSEDE